MGVTSKDLPVSNRNTMIMADLGSAKIGKPIVKEIFAGLPYPSNEGGRKFSSPEEFFTWEFGWHSLDTYNKAYTKMREIFGPGVFGACGATAGKFVNLGTMKNMKYALGGVEGALQNVPKINKIFNDTKEFIMLKGPTTENFIVRASYIIRFHDDIDPHDDWKSDPHIRGILSQIGRPWDMPTGTVSQPIVPYSLERLCEKEHEFKSLDLDPRVEGDTLFIRDPITKTKRGFGKRVKLIPANVPEETKERIAPQLFDVPIFDGSYHKNAKSDYTGFFIYGGLKIEHEDYTGQGGSVETTLIPPWTILAEGLYFVTNYEGMAAPKNPFTRMVRAFHYKFSKEVPDEEDSVKTHMALVQENKAKEEALKEQARLLGENQDLIMNLEKMVEARTSELKEEQVKRQHAETMAAVTYLHIGMAHNLRNPLKAIEVLMNQQAATCETLLMDPRFLRVWGIEENDYEGLVSILQEKYNEKTELKDIDTGVATIIGKELKNKLKEIEPDLELSVRQARNLATYNILGSDLVNLQPFIKKYSLDAILEILDYSYKIKSPKHGAKKKFTEAFEIINSTMDVAEMANREDHETDLNQGITKIITEYESIFQDQEIVVKTEFEECLPKINMDRRFIETIYHNLISNALYAIRPFSDKREVSFKTYSHEGTVFAEIKDSGEGIPEKNITKIFLPFFSTKPEGEGKGIGLYSVHEIMNLYGTIEVTSKERETRFKLIFRDTKKTINL